MKKRRRFPLDGGGDADVENKTMITNGSRHGRFFSLFTVVKFDNDACATSNGDNGTCYTSTQVATP